MAPGDVEDWSDMVARTRLRRMAGAGYLDRGEANFQAGAACLLRAYEGSVNGDV
jgi:hypothetical protein